MTGRDAISLSRLFLESCRTYPKPVRMSVKRGGVWVKIATDEIEMTVRRLSLGFQDLGFGPGDRLAILSENRPEWVMVDFATLCRGALTVPIYTTLVPEQVQYIIEDSDAKIAVYSGPEQWRKIEAVKGRLTKVKHFISFSSEAPKGVLTLERVFEMGRKADAANPGLFEREALLVIVSIPIYRFVYKPRTLSDSLYGVLVRCEFLLYLDQSCRFSIIIGALLKSLPKT